MTIEAKSGPIIVYQDGGILSNTSANQNPDNGPSLFNIGVGLLDPRSPFTYFPGMGNSPVGFTSAGVAINAAPNAIGWVNAEFMIANYAPATASTTTLVASANISATTSVTLTATSTYGFTTGSSVVNAATGQLVTGLWLIDSAPASVTYGQSGTVGAWNPATPPIGRCISLSTTATDISGTTFTVRGFDAYGYPITWTGVGSTSSATVYTSKAFKWIQSVTSSRTTATTFSMGLSDIYGLPFYTTSLLYLTAYWDGTALAAANTTFTAGVAATTAGASDVRGLINIAASPGPSDGVKKLVAWLQLDPANVGTASGLFGTHPPA